jgi:hypothetical protein
MEKSEGKRPLGKPTRRWAGGDNIKINLGCDGVDWILPAQD